MINIPTNKPTQAQVITTVAGVAVAVLGYFFPQLAPALAPLGKLLWAGGWGTAGAGLVQFPSKAEP